MKAARGDAHADRRQQAVDRIIEATRHSFFDFIEKRQPAFPTVLQRMSAGPFGASYFLRPSAWFSLKQFRVRDRRYMFLTAKHPDFLQRLAGKAVALIGTRQEFVRASRLEFGFCFSGDLYLAAHAILFGRRGIPVQRILSRWIALFEQQQDPCYLVLPHDTSPISLLLCKIADECPNMRSVCIQHGLFNAGSDLDDIEGRNSRINLVYDEAQKAEMLRRLPRASVETMGFPADLPAAAARQNEPWRIILIGTGSTEQPELLAKAVEIYGRVDDMLRPLVSSVQYRPHPAEERSGKPLDYGMALNREDKRKLLSSHSTIFMGFNSTLLYEAHLSGHLVIVLDHPELPGYSISRFGLRLPVSDLNELPGLIFGHRDRAKSPRLPVANVGERFEQALKDVERRSFVGPEHAHFPRQPN